MYFMTLTSVVFFFFFFQAEDGIRDLYVTEFRRVLFRSPLDRALSALVGELSTRSQEFRVRWAAHDVDYYRSGAQPFHHPLVGDLTLDYDVLELPADPGLSIVAYSAEAGTPARHALDLLATWTSTADQAPAATADTDP